MKIHPQTIYRDKKPEFVVLPVKEYNKLISAFEDFQDIQEIRDYLANPGETFPMEVVQALSEGICPIKVYREYRGLSQSSLAQKAHVSKQYISQMIKELEVNRVITLKRLGKSKIPTKIVPEGFKVTTIVQSE